MLLRKNYHYKQLYHLKRHRATLESYEYEVISTLVSAHSISCLVIPVKHPDDRTRVSV